MNHANTTCSAHVGIVFLAIALVTLQPCSAVAQTPQAVSEGALCSRAVDLRLPDAIADVKARAAATTERSEFFRGCTALIDKRSDQASAAFRKAGDAAPSDPVTRLWLGRALGAQAEHAFVVKQAVLARRSREAFESAVALAPEYVAAREALMQFALQAPRALGGGVDRARAQADEIARRDTHRGTVARLSIARHERDRAKAIQLLEQISAAFPDSIKYQTALVTELSALRHWTRAWHVVDAVEKQQPDAVRLQYTIGSLAAQSGQQPERGDAALQRYLRADVAPGAPSHAQAWWRLGQIAESSGRRNDARNAYQRAVTLDPKLAPASAALERVR